MKRIPDWMGEWLEGPRTPNSDDGTVSRWKNQEKKAYLFRQMLERGVLDPDFATLPEPEYIPALWREPRDLPGGPAPFTVTWSWHVLARDQLCKVSMTLEEREAAFLAELSALTNKYRIGIADFGCGCCGRMETCETKEDVTYVPSGSSFQFRTEAELEQDRIEEQERQKVQARIKRVIQEREAQEAADPELAQRRQRQAELEAQGKCDPFFQGLLDEHTTTTEFKDASLIQETLRRR